MQGGQGIYTVELYLRVRLAVSEGMTKRQAAKHFNISRDSVAKMVAYSTPPGYQRRSPIRRPKLDAFVSTIDHWLDEDLKVPRKQRHTAKRVFDRLRDEPEPGVRETLTWAIVRQGPDALAPALAICALLDAPRQGRQWECSTCRASLQG